MYIYIYICIHVYIYIYAHTLISMYHCLALFIQACCYLWQNHYMQADPPEHREAERGTIMLLIMATVMFVMITIDLNISIISHLKYASKGK